MKEALRVRQSGADLKPPQAAVVKSDGGERCGNAGTRFRQARSREASASELLQKCRKRIRRCQNRGVTLAPGSARGMPGIARAASGMKAAGREKPQAAPTARARVPTRNAGAEQPVVASKVL